MKTQTPVKHYEGGGIRINNSYDAETIEQKPIVTGKQIGRAHV